MDSKFTDMLARLQIEVFQIEDISKIINFEVENVIEAEKQAIKEIEKRGEIL